jgi:hypothetical protein
MSDPKLQAAYAAVEEKRRKAAIARDHNTMPLDFGVSESFDVIDNPGAYAEDPIWKRYWKTEGIRAVNPDGSIITDAMERFRQAFELGYMACRKIEKTP